MARYNKNFNLDRDDLDLIEAALRENKQSLSQAGLSGDTEAQESARDIHELLGRLHNQKKFYRPSTGVYVGG